MAPLTYTRLIKGLNSLVEKANTDLPGFTFLHHRKEIARAVNAGMAAAQAGPTGEPGAMSPGKIKHWVGDKVDEILQNINPPSAIRPATITLGTSTSAGTGAGVKKRHNTRAKSSRKARFFTSTDIGCANELLELAAKAVDFAKPARNFWSVVG
jgi:hypothetical protein